MRLKHQEFFKSHWPLLIPIPILLGLISFTLGRYPIGLDDLLKTIYWYINDPTQIIDPNMSTVLFEIRIPRVIVVIMVGAGISMAGSAYQGMFRNPLVSPDILGATAGASFGAAMGIIAQQPISVIQLYAFVGGLLSVFLATRFEKMVKYDPILALVLGGMLVKALFNAGLSIIKYLSDPEQTLPAITFWLMGTFTDVIPSHMIQVGIPLVISGIFLFVNRQRLNVASFGEEEARAMGINTKRVRLEVIGACTLITASSVSICGQIGWIGLIVPHLARSLTGPNYRALIPVSALIGSSFLLICDTICRNAFAVELPIGLLTSILGIPFFVIIFKQKAGRA
ncbi:iron ABC transporter permease [Proteiniborus sp. MB09-C3]|uniref:FecCD family ABC transporter permease n=1 Tax=Proteiniborus sp. MB09-C3 TaxID=3050072 RepID=UPI0025556768|nr:iron ABC transporter permease [Proteiniborus sp. MB09-C3]WIV13412.1 iron ABC transporter permease [Proteiniborus sp. MB09-C3]